MCAQKYSHWSLTNCMYIQGLAICKGPIRFPPQSSHSWLATCFHDLSTCVDNDASLVARLVNNPPAMQETPGSIPGSGSSPGEGLGYPPQYSWASLVARMVKKKKKKNPPAMWETWVRSLGLGRSFGGMHGNPFQYSCLEIFTDRGGVGSERVGQDWVTKHKH